jgi:hypothetical protein
VPLNGSRERDYGRSVVYPTDTSSCWSLKCHDVGPVLSLGIGARREKAYENSQTSPAGLIRGNLRTHFTVDATLRVSVFNLKHGPPLERIIKQPIHLLFNLPPRCLCEDVCVGGVCL